MFQFHPQGLRTVSEFTRSADTRKGRDKVYLPILYTHCTQDLVTESTGQYICIKIHRIRCHFAGAPYWNTLLNIYLYYNYMRIIVMVLKEYPNLGLKNTICAILVPVRMYTIFKRTRFCSRIQRETTKLSTTHC